MTEDQVGYGRPPVHSRFKPGQSGNPKGRPKNSPSFAKELRAELAEMVRIREDDHEITVSKQRAIIKSLVSRAVAGDMRAAHTIVSLSERLFGPPADEDDDNASVPPDDQELLEKFVAHEVERRTAKVAPAEGSGNSESEGGATP